MYDGGVNFRVSWLWKFKSFRGKPTFSESFQEFIFAIEDVDSCRDKEIDSESSTTADIGMDMRWVFCDVAVLIMN